jgi:hypothetical protein
MREASQGIRIVEGVRTHVSGGTHYYPHKQRLLSGETVSTSSYMSYTKRPRTLTTAAAGHWRLLPGHEVEVGDRASAAVKEVRTSKVPEFAVSFVRRARVVQLLLRFLGEKGWGWKFEARWCGQETCIREERR